MSVEGDRRPGILEDNTQQHLRLFNPEANSPESSTMTAVEDIRVEVTTSLKEKVFHLTMLCIELILCCGIFVFVIFCLLNFVSVFSVDVGVKCNVNSTYHLDHELLHNSSFKREILG